MGRGDVAKVHALAENLHRSHPERIEVFAERLDLFPEGCYVLASGEGASIVGYCIAHPWSGVPPALDTLLVSLPQKVTYFFVHDIALDPSARGAGHGAAAIALARDISRSASLPELRLIAVNGTELRWRALGFERIADPRLASYVRAGYGDGAVAMRRASDT